MSDTWKDAFREQIDDGKFWKKLFKDDFNEHQFLDRSDAVYICKKAQADAYQNVINAIKDKVDKSVIDEIEQIIIDLWDNDDSSLGMVAFNGQVL